MRKKLWIIPLLFLIVFLTGCSSNSQPPDVIKFVTGLLSPKQASGVFNPTAGKILTLEAKPNPVEVTQGITTTVSLNLTATAKGEKQQDVPAKITLVDPAGKTQEYDVVIKNGSFNWTVDDSMRGKWIIKAESIGFASNPTQIEVEVKVAPAAATVTPTATATPTPTQTPAPPPATQTPVPLAPATPVRTTVPSTAQPVATVAPAKAGALGFDAWTSTSSDPRPTPVPKKVESLKPVGDEAVIKPVTVQKPEPLPVSQYFLPIIGAVLLIGLGVKLVLRK